MIQSRASVPPDSISGSTASFRDPAGIVVLHGDRVLRVVGRLGVDGWHAYQRSAAAQDMVSRRAIVQTRQLAVDEAESLLVDPVLASVYARAGGTLILEHERIPFPSYPYEWAPEMLCAAGELTLDIGRSLLRDGAGLKDATPYNVMFRGPAPVFLDVLSFESRHPGHPIWMAEAQFQRTFVLPLLANRELGIGLDQIFLARRDGVEPADLYRSLGALRCVRPGFFGSVLMPALLSGRGRTAGQLYQPRVIPDVEKARFILSASYGRAARALERARPPGGRSQWSGYMEGQNNYSAEHFARKERFVRAVLEEFPARRVLDVGCNTGHFSLMAAGTGASVVAIDYDSAVVGDMWKKARAADIDILPLVVDLSRPTPGVGWRNREGSPFLERAKGAFDLVLMLAVIHHMLVTERVPLDEIIDVASELTGDLALVEFVGPGDSMFQHLLRGREHLHKDLSVATFEAACRRRFAIVRVDHMDGTDRWLYLLRKTPA